MFIFKKIISQFLFPLALSIEISLLGLFLLWFTARQRTGKVCLSIGLCTLTLLSYGTVSDRVLGSLENSYPPYEAGHLSGSLRYPIKFVLVLGGGHTSDPGLPVTSQISDASLVRLIEGVRIHRKHPGSKLLLSGGLGFDPYSDAAVMAEVAREIGVPGGDIVLEGQSRDTKDEALILKGMVGSRPFILVTSASHMPRAMALFKKQGMHPVPAPTGHQVKKKWGLSPGSFFPNAEDLRKSETAVHEYLGLAWAKLRGQV